MFSNDTRILVVDDMLTMRKLVSKSLKDLGFEQIIEAKDGVEAWSKIEGEGCDLIISDWNMPNMKGIELLEKVKGNEATKHIPFILLTAESERAQVSAAIEKGANEYMVKPFTKESLEQKLRSVWDKTGDLKKAG